MKARTSYSSWAEGFRQLATVINTFIDGRTGEVTLTTSSTTTTVSDSRVGINSKINLSPTTANAASEITTTYISSKTKESFTITHASNATADRTYDYTIEG